MSDREDFWSFTVPCDMKHDLSTEQLMSKAILAERERCAKIAEDYGTGGYGQHNNMVVAQRASEEIAAAIRNRTSHE